VDQSSTCFEKTIVLHRNYGSALFGRQNPAKSRTAAGTRAAVLDCQISSRLPDLGGPSLIHSQNCPRSSTSKLTRSQATDISIPIRPGRGQRALIGLCQICQSPVRKNQYVTCCSRPAAATCCGKHASAVVSERTNVTRHTNKTLTRGRPLIYLPVVKKSPYPCRSALRWSTPAGRTDGRQVNMIASAVIKRPAVPMLHLFGGPAGWPAHKIGQYAGAITINCRCGEK